MSKHEIIECGLVHFHNVVFFARKNFKEKIDPATDKGPQGGALRIEMLEVDGMPAKLTIKGEGHTLHLPAISVFSYTPRIEQEKHKPVQTTSNASANTKINAQASGPHDHVFAGLGQGQTGVGSKVK